MAQKLYILRPAASFIVGTNPWEPWYDKAFGFVVSAKSPAEARKLAAKERGNEGEAAWLEATYSSCKELKPSEKSEVIMEDVQAA